MERDAERMARGFNGRGGKSLFPKIQKTTNSKAIRKILNKVRTDLDMPWFTPLRCLNRYYQRGLC